MWKSTLFKFSYNLYKENIALKFTNIYKKINAIKKVTEEIITAKN